MILFTSTAHKLQLVTGSAGLVSSHTSSIDKNQSTGAISEPPPLNLSITTATTTDIVTAPASGVSRNLQTLCIRNGHATNSNLVTVQHTDGTTVSPLYQCTLLAGESLHFIDGRGWQKLNANGLDASTGPQGPTGPTGPAGPAVADGDKGDITVTGGVWTIDNNAVTNADLAQMPAKTIKGNDGSSTANAADLTPSQARLTLSALRRAGGVWWVTGHSYVQTAKATPDRTDRMDARAFASLGINAHNIMNLAVDGSRGTRDHAGNMGGWPMLMRHTNINRNITSGPFTSSGGGLLWCFGINDIGNYTNTAQNLTAYQHMARTHFSRWRAAAVWDNTVASGIGQVTFGTGFVNTTGQDDISTMGTLRVATATTNATGSWTVPAAYNGEPISFCFIGNAGVTGGTVTFAGTAGVTGTISTSNIMASANATTCPVIKRITNLTSANIGQTITFSVTALDAGGNVRYDSMWIEAKAAPPIIVCNIARITATAAGNYSAWTTAQPTDSGRDADVAAWNAGLSSVVAEFDSMIQVADIDGALGKNAANMSQAAPAEIHPNAIGASYCDDAIGVAHAKLAPVYYSPASSMTPAANSAASLRRLFTVGNYYTALCAGISASTYTCVSGDMFAFYFPVTEGRTRFDQVAFEVTNVPTTGVTLRCSGYFSYGEINGYPSCRTTSSEWSTSIAMGAAAGVKTATPTPIEFDPGPSGYWIVVKITGTVGATAPTLRCIFGPANGMPELGTNGLPIAAASMPVAYKLTGQGTGALPSAFPPNATLVPTAPYLGLRAAAQG